MHIKRLPTQLANQIAAGEVIERPASVVKECVENAIDAKSTHITIDIDKGGMERILICDNGIGIDYDDLPLSIAPHATSKISQVSDLNQIESLGFRGEALASISAVSICRVISKTSTAEKGYEIKTEGGTSPIIKPAAHPVGTTIEVSSLFFNVPVRRTFLKSEKAEFHQIEAIVKRIALSHDEIAFTFIHNGKVIFKLPLAITELAKEKRIIKLFGKPFFETATKIAVSNNGICLSGYLGSPDFMRSHNDLQYTYINARMVKDKLINHAIKQVYQPLLYPGRVPSFLLYLTLSARDVDVNVHPTKHEVRFKYARDVHDFIMRELSQVLLDDDGSHHAREITPTPNNAAINCNTHPSGLSSQAESVVFDANLIALAGEMALLTEKDNSTLFNVLKVYEALIVQKFNLLFKKNEVVSRPLLVPTSYTLSDTAVRDYPFELVAQLGFDISPIDQDKLLVRAFPLITPHLALGDCITHLAKANSLAQAIKIIARAHTITLKILSPQERTELTTYLMQHRDTVIIKKHSRTLYCKDWADLLRA